VIFVISERIFSQWSGANSITSVYFSQIPLLEKSFWPSKAYAPELFSLLGLAGQSEKLFVTAIFGAVKFLASLLCAILLIDHVGRKGSLISGIIIQLIALLYISIFLTVKSAFDDESSFMNRAAIAAIVFIYFVGVGWAIGWNSIQYPSMPRFSPCMCESRDQVF
jgi:hypothetical protein